LEREQRTTGAAGTALGAPRVVGSLIRSRYRPFCQLGSPARV
jgi:hypothetical protein